MVEMVSETGPGYRAGGADLVAGCIRQGRSQGSICVYRTTRVRDRRCSDASAIIALRLAYYTYHTWNETHQRVTHDNEAPL